MFDSRPAWVWPRAAYVHVPFCAFHCGYCDFAVAVGRDDQMDRYLNALDRELARMGLPQPVQTLFFGGGTPTYLPAWALDRLLTLARRWFLLPSGGEFSVEANPGTLDEEKLRLLAAHGVNRLSLGAQSFHPHLLQVLERDHLPEDVPRAMEIARKYIPVISLDLIFGVPGQDLAGWQFDLDQALRLQPDHVAAYGLTFEKGTRLWKQRRRGQVRSLDEETELSFFTEAMDRLADAGFEQYEISNFARPGKRCRHNQVYWANHAYFGAGMGAARYVEGIREVNSRDLSTYLRQAERGDNPAFQHECLEGEDRALETLAIQLRRLEGVERESFQVQTGYSLDGLRGSKIAGLVDLGLLEDTEIGVRLTRRGKCLADAVITQLL